MRIRPVQVPGVGVYVRSLDHCDPHVHAEHRKEGWEAWFDFDFLTPTVSLRKIEIARGGRPLGRQDLSLVLQQIAAHLADCRAAWWNVHGTTCLENKFVQDADGGGLVIVRGGPSRHMPQVTSAAYDPATRTTTVRIRGQGARQVVLP